MKVYLILAWSRGRYTSPLRWRLIQYEAVNLLIILSLVTRYAQSKFFSPSHILMYIYSLVKCALYHICIYFISLDRMWDPIAYALGFLDCDHISARCMLTIFMLFAIRTEASVLRMLEGSPQTGLHDPILRC